MKNKIKLYSYFRSSCSYRVRIALNIKNQDYETIPVHLVKGQQLSEDYKLLNPMGQVPCLEFNGQVITQSLAIIEFLEEKITNLSLLPKDPFLRAKVRELSEIINSGVQPLQNFSVLKVLKKDFNMSDEQKIIWIKNAIKKGFVSYENKMQEVASNFSIGDKVSMADICLIPQVFNAKRFGLDMSEFKNINRVNENCLNLDAFKKAHPNQQPDFSK